MAKRNSSMRKQPNILVIWGLRETEMSHIGCFAIAPELTRRGDGCHT